MVSSIESAYAMLATKLGTYSPLCHRDIAVQASLKGLKPHATIFRDPGLGKSKSSTHSPHACGYNLSRPFPQSSLLV